MHVAPAMPAFLRRYPDIAIDLSLEERHVSLVDERLDLAIRIGALPDSPLIVRKLAPSRLVLCAAPDYLERRGAPSAPRDLAGHACLCFPPLWRDGHWHLTGKLGQERVPIAASCITNSAEVLRACALGGMGIAMLPTWAVAEELRSGTLVAVLPGSASPASVIHAVYPANRRMSAKVRSFVDHLAHHIGRSPYWDRDL
jgi:DNA-binding transcriptional LysR family regulator